MKIFLSVLLVVILVFSLALGVDENAMNIHDEAFQRAMVAFGLAKGLNAVISLLQGTELSFAPVGISLIFIWKKELYNKAYFTLPFKILFLFIVLRFGAITSVYMSEFLYNSVLHVEYAQSKEIITQTKNTLEQIHQKNEQLVKSKKDAVWYQLDVGTKYNELMSNMNISSQLDSLKSSIELASKNIITLITIFIVQSVLMPLIFLWFFLISIKWIFRVKVNSDTILLSLTKR